MSKDLDGEEKKLDANAVFAGLAKVVGPIAQSMGVPTAVYVLIFGTIYIFASSTTRDEFIRALLFPPAENHELRWAFGCIGIVMLIGGYLKQQSNKDEKSENERLRKVNEGLQKKLLESPPASSPALTVVSKDGV